MSSSAKIDPTRLLIRDFSIRTMVWNSYTIDHPRVKGRLRLLTVLADLFETPEEMLPKNSKLPQFQPLYSTLSRFVNEGEKGESDRSPFTQEEFQKRVKEDVTDSIVLKEEPVNEYAVVRDKVLLFRTETKVSKVHHVRFRWNAFGDPILIAESNTTHTLAEYESGEVAAKS